MATETLSLLVTAKDQASGKIGTISGSVKKLGSTAKTAAKVGIGALTAGTVAFIGVMSKATAAANVQEQAEVKLATALKNAGQYTEANFQALKDQASALQRVSTVGDETTIALQSMAIGLGISAKEADKVVTTALTWKKRSVLVPHQASKTCRKLWAE